MELTNVNYTDDIKQQTAPWWQDTFAASAILIDHVRLLLQNAFSQ